MHDANGKPLKVGDEVILRASIESITPGIGYCDTRILLKHPMRNEKGEITNTYNTLYVHCAQVELVEEKDLPEPK